MKRLNFTEGFYWLSSIMICATLVIWLYLPPNYTPCNPQVTPHETVHDTVHDTGHDAIAVTVTTYNATKEQCDDTPNITSIGAKITKGVKWVAVSQDLLDFHLNYMDLVYLEVSQPPGSTKNNESYSGWYKVMDRTAYYKNKKKKIRMLNTVDILITDDRWGGKWEGIITKIK